MKTESEARKTWFSEHPLKLMMAAYWNTPKRSAEEAICAAAVDMMLKLPNRPALAFPLLLV